MRSSNNIYIHSSKKMRFIMGGLLLLGGLTLAGVVGGTVSAAAAGPSISRTADGTVVQHHADGRVSYKKYYSLTGKVLPEAVPGEPYVALAGDCSVTEDRTRLWFAVYNAPNPSFVGAALRQGPGGPSNPYTPAGYTGFSGSIDSDASQVFTSVAIVHNPYYLQSLWVSARWHSTTAPLINFILSVPACKS